MVKTFIGPGVALVLCLAMTARAAEETPVQVTGEGTALGLGPAARSTAIADAQASIVLDRLEEIAPSRDFSIFLPLLQSAPAYFQSYKLLRETKTEDSTQVEIEAELLDRKLKEQIAGIVLAQNFVTPRILILAQEQLVPADKPDVGKLGGIEKKLQEDLKRIQFEIVSPETTREKIPPEQWGRCIEGDPEYAAILAREMLADIVVLANGTSHVEEERTAAHLNRVRAEVTLRVVRAEDAYVLDAPKAEAVVNCVDPSEGSAQAIEDACGKLVGDAKTAVALGALSGAPDNALLVTLEGSANDSQTSEVIAALKQCLGVEKDEITFKGDGRVRVRLDYAGPVGELVDRLPACSVASGRLSLKTVVNRDVTLVLERN